MKKVILLISTSLFCFKLDRVILSSDSNPVYLDNWELVAKSWSNIVGIKPTLALIANDDVKIDESLGDVIRFKPIPGIPDGFYAQVVRLLLPAMFGQEFCIISDIDMMPISKDYFLKSVANINKDYFVIYKSTLYYDKNSPEYAMCYVAARGELFKHLFELGSIEGIEEKVKEWFNLGLGWSTDQKLLYKQVHKSIVPVKRLNHGFHRRIDRWIRDNKYFWSYDINKFKQGYYSDFHLPRPIQLFYNEIHALYNMLLSKNRISL